MNEGCEFCPLKVTVILGEKHRSWRDSLHGDDGKKGAEKDFPVQQLIEIMALLLRRTVRCDGVRGARCDGTAIEVAEHRTSDCDVQALANIAWAFV